METVYEAALSSFFEALFDKLAPFDLLNFMRQERVQDEIEQWKEMLRRIRAVMEDAEEKQMTNRLVKIWLKDLTDLTYDADDILDEFATEVLRRKLNAEADQSKPQPRPSKLPKTISAVSGWIPRAVTDFIPSAFTGLSPSAVTFNMKMGSQIKEITARFEKIVKEKNDLDLREFSGGRTERPRATGWRSTTSVVTEAHVHGRDEDKKAIKLLLSEESSDAHFSVIPILGMGGLGKTTLAQLVYNDKEVNANFDMKAWVCVSDEFDVFRVTKAALESFTSGSCNVSELNTLQVKLKEILSGKKFLLILDDIWNENYEDWTKLCCPFEGGARGSKIVATTRNEGVASTMTIIEPYRLKELPNDACLCIFTQHALGMRDFSAYSELEVTGREILKKCKGLPLAVKTLGGILRTKKSHDGWEKVLHSKIWDIPEKKGGIILALRLSYQHLPSHLKRCFAYCSIFPKDFEFKKDDLVLLWLAEGLIQQPKGNNQMEDVGSEYFLDLHSRSFFQQSSSNKSCFVMHDLIHDMAQWVAGDLCFRLEDEYGVSKQSKISAKARHSSYIRSYGDVKAKFEALYEVKYLRTFLPLPEQEYCYLTSYVTFDLLPHLKCLRVLSLSGYEIVELPDSIGDLKHLRYLNLSSTHIRSLPESTSCLYNLQILILKSCSYLTKLPEKLRNLINLRLLDITGVSSIKEMPVGMKELKNLQTLSDFVVGKDSGSRIGDLMNLEFLRGTLCISRLENVISAQDAKNANLNGKKLDALVLNWSSEFDNSQHARVDVDVLDILRPHITLKELTIQCYAGAKFPTWLGDLSFSKMVLLKIENCKKCTSLPPLGQLPSLKDLSIRGMDVVRRVGLEFYGEGFLKPFQSLERLYFENMQEWEEWIVDYKEFPHLREFSISRCPNLQGKLPNVLPSLEKLSINECDQLVGSISNLPMSCELNIYGCKEVVHRSMGESSSLKNVVLFKISELKSPTGEEFMQWIGKAKYLEINNCKGLTYLWQDKVGALQQSTSLAHLAKDSCTRFNSSITGEQEGHQQLEMLYSLEILKLANCESLEKLPQGLHCLTSLRKLEIAGCPRLVSFLDVGLPSMLRELIVSNCDALNSLHEAMMCKKTAFLESLEIDGCNSLASIVKGQLPPTLKRLIISNCKKLQYVVDEGEGSSLNDNTSLLEYLKIRSCSLRKFFSSRSRGDIPATLNVVVSDCVELTSLSLPVPLKSLHLEDCPKLESIVGVRLDNNFSLESLYIWNCEKFKSLPEGLHNLYHLNLIFIWNCSSLVTFSNGGLLPTNLRTLWIMNCEKLETLPNHMNNLTYLQSLQISSCPGIVSFPEEGFPTSLSDLHISGLNICKPVLEWGLHRLSSLRRLSISGGCPDWVSFLQEDEKEDGKMMMMLPTSLTRLSISNFPNLLSSKGFEDLFALQFLHIYNCPKLTSLPQKGLPPSLLTLSIYDCPLLKQHCEKDKGREWVKIAHIPCVQISGL